MNYSSSSFIPTRESLLNRIKNWSDAESWRDFFDTYCRLIRSSALKAGLSEDEAAEVVQETLLGVAKGIKTFRRERGSFKAWLLTLTRWRIADQFRKRMNDTRSFRFKPIEECALDELPECLGPSLDEVWEDEWKRAVMAGALNIVRLRADPQYLQIFDFYVNKRWPVLRIANFFGISRARVYLAKYRVAKAISKEVERLSRGLV